MATSLSTEAQSSNMTSYSPVFMHDFIGADVVSYEVKAAADDFNSLNLLTKDFIRVCLKVEVFDQRGKLDGHLEELGLF